MDRDCLLRIVALCPPHRRFKQFGIAPSKLHVPNGFQIKLANVLTRNMYTHEDMMEIKSEYFRCWNDAASTWRHFYNSHIGHTARCDREGKQDLLFHHVCEWYHYEWLDKNDYWV